jgi:hypothetical protein
VLIAASNSGPLVLRIVDAASSTGAMWWINRQSTASLERCELILAEMGLNLAASEPRKGQAFVRGSAVARWTDRAYTAGRGVT